MFPCATYVVGAATALLLAADTPALAGSSPAARFIFTCDPATTPQLCALVRDALHAAYPDRLVEMGEDAHAAALHLVIEHETSERLSGHLHWSLTNDAHGRSETLDLMALDVPLNADLMRGFAHDLVRHARLPF
ncbi:MAG: hypothetical protein AB3N11_13920 [Arenibacterium sp.]